MKNSLLLKIVLFIAGLIIAGIGGAELFTPIGFHAASGIALGDDINLMNEIRAPGGALLASGLLVIAGAFFAALTFTSTIVATMLYLSYGFSRLYSMAIDGLPDVTLLQATGLEIAIGLICAFALVRYQASNSANSP